MYTICKGWFSYEYILFFQRIHVIGGRIPLCPASQSVPILIFNIALSANDSYTWRGEWTKADTIGYW